MFCLCFLLGVYNNPVFPQETRKPKKCNLNLHLNQLEKKNKQNPQSEVNKSYKFREEMWNRDKGNKREQQN